ncbi:uncharacterized protein B0H18DRAFT_22606 [Fomitopsis serialis]|uniref:uncharacterized protein n=1 Tax=Fomitopsis serialis TaxID=139415 RepID=UPI002007FA9B|nr:uncharacterized protein B0H18DRAFT_22606 [Neoantrodia serialis]KAH9938666.1 hypothetical protein B0H18DRAFT_22606 [Neoantrodia serialis]
MPIDNPAQLVEEFKKSGEFDRLRRELLAQFRSSDAMDTLMSRVEDIIKERLASDQKLYYMPETVMTRELMQELDRYPLVERAAGETRALSDPAFTSGVRNSIKSILQEDRRNEGKYVDGMDIDGIEEETPMDEGTPEDDDTRVVRFVNYARSEPDLEPREEPANEDLSESVAPKTGLDS